MAMGHKTTKHMDDSPFWEVDNSSAGKDISHRLRNPKVYYCVPNSLNFVSNTFCALKLHGDSANPLYNLGHGKSIGLLVAFMIRCDSVIQLLIY
jgi:hypothetical protein